MRVGSGEGTEEGSNEGTGKGICEGTTVGRPDGKAVGPGIGAKEVVGCGVGNISNAPLFKQKSVSPASPEPNSFVESMDMSAISQETACVGLVPPRANAKQLLLPTHPKWTPRVLPGASDPPNISVSRSQMAWLMLEHAKMLKLR